MLEPTVGKKNMRIDRSFKCKANEDYFCLEGYPVPLIFECNTKKLITWTRNARNSGREVEVDELSVIQATVRKWYRTHIEGDEALLISSRMAREEIK